MIADDWPVLLFIAYVVCLPFSYWWLRDADERLESEGHSRPGWFFVPIMTVLTPILLPLYLIVRILGGKKC